MLNPRTVRLKSLMPFWVRSTPGRRPTARAACPVGASWALTAGSMVLTAAGASMVGSGPREAPVTTISPSWAGAICTVTVSCWVLPADMLTVVVKAR